MPGEYLYEGAQSGAGETVDCMLQDVAEGRLLDPATPDPAAAETMVRAGQPSCISWADWRKIQEIEDAHGAELGRPRLKMTSAEEMLAALQRD